MEALRVGLRTTFSSISTVEQRMVTVRARAQTKNLKTWRR